MPECINQAGYAVRIFRYPALNGTHSVPYMTLQIYRFQTPISVELFYNINHAI